MVRECIHITKIVGVVSLYWVVSISLVFVNKMLLQKKMKNGDVSLFICWFQSSSGTLFITVFLKAWKRFEIKSEILLHTRILGLSTLFVTGLIFNMLMLKYIGVAFYQVARSTTLVFVVIFTYIILREGLSSKSFVCCLVVVAGFLIGADQEGVSRGFSIVGIAYGILASCVIGLTTVFMKLSQRMRVTSLELTFYYNFLSSVIFTILLISTNQISAILENFPTFSYTFWFWLTYSGLLSVCMGWTSALQIEYTSPMTHHVSISAKSAFQTIIAVVYLQESKTLLWWFGTSMTIFGTIAYAVVKLKEDSRVTLHSETIVINKIPSNKNSQLPL